MSSLLVQAVLIGLAAWRASALISYERGPFSIFLRAREALGFQHSDSGEPNAWPSNALAEAISCPWCLGVYLAVGMWGLWELEPVAVVVIAASTIVVIVEKWARP